MANSKALAREVRLSNGRPVELNTLVREYNSNKNIAYDGTNIVITAKNGRVYRLDITDMTSAEYKAFFSTEFANVDGVLDFFKANNTYFDSEEMFRDLYKDANNYDYFASYYKHDSERFLDQIKDKPRTTKNLVAGLNVKQANDLLAKSLEDEDLNSIAIWGNLPEATKYNPELFEKVVSKNGAPLVSSLPEYNKYTNKAKLIKLLANPKTKLEEVVAAFGARVVYSDSVFVDKLLNEIENSAKQAKPKEYAGILQKLKTIQTQVKEYAAETAAFNNMVLVPGEFRNAAFQRFTKSKSNKSKSFSEFRLSKLEKEFVKQQVLKFDLDSFLSGDQKAIDKQIKVWTNGLAGQKYKGKKMNINLDKLFLDSDFVKEIFNETVSAAATYRYYYGQKNKNGKTVFLSPEKIKQGAEAFTGALYNEHKEYMKKVAPISKMDTTAKLKEIEKDHTGVDVMFADTAKLKQGKKNKILKDIEKGKYAGKKGSDKINTVFKKYGEKISTDKAFVTEMLATLEAKTVETSFEGKKDKSNVKDNVAKSVKLYEPVFNKVAQCYSDRLDKMDLVTKEIAEAKKVLETVPYYEQQQANTQTQEQEQEDGGMSHTK